MEQPRTLSLREAIEVWALIAGQSFGGAAGQIAVAHRTLVEERRWLGEQRFLHALNYCMLLPGPEAQQLLIYVGWLSHGYTGGLVAGWLFVLPGFVSILGLSVMYALFHQVPAVAAGLFGLEAAVLAVVLEAGIRIGRRVLDRPSTVLVALAAFVALFFFQVPLPAVIVAAGVLGAVARGQFPPPEPPKPRDDVGPRPLLDAMLDDDRLPHVHPSLRRDLAVAAGIAAVWLLPTAVVWAALGGDDPFTQVGRLFSTSAVVSFGGGYATVAYVGQQAVEAHHRLLPAEVADGLGLAQTVPGPLIQVVQLAGFLATYRDPGALPPMVAGVLGAALTAWATFTPSFLFVLAGAPYLERVRTIAALSSSLRAITASVVGVIGNVGLWLTLHVWFGSVAELRWHGLRIVAPDPSSVRPLAIAIGVVAAIGVLRFRFQALLVLLVGAVAGLAGWLLG